MGLQQVRRLRLCAREQLTARPGALASVPALPGLRSLRGSRFHPWWRYDDRAWQLLRCVTLAAAALGQELANVISEISLCCTLWLHFARLCLERRRGSRRK